jgi:UTP--glucose-1-phosphate uridylyltransferase
MFEMVRKVVIPAAGLGTRFLPATKAVPKEMLPIVDVPTLQLVVEEAVRAGFTDVVLVNGRQKESLEDHFDVSYELEDTLRRRGKAREADELRALSRLAKLVSVRQKEPLGLGHAVLAARPAVGDEPFAVMLGDDLIDSPEPGIGQLLRVARETGKAVVALVEVPAEETHRYGVAAGRTSGGGITSISHLVEKPPPGTAPSNLAIFGRYVLPPDVFDILARQAPGSGGEIQLTDALAALAAEDRLVGWTMQGVRFDAGDRLGYLKANLHWALKREELRGPLMSYLRSLVAGV